MTSRRRQTGNAYLGAASLVVICGVLAAGVLLPNLGRYDAAVTSLDGERAFQLAEAGIDRGLVTVRGADAPVTARVALEDAVDAVGSYTVTITPGATNRRDDDGDGEVDEADESGLVRIDATGMSGAATRRLEAVLTVDAEAPRSARVTAWHEHVVATPDDGDAR